MARLNLKDIITAYDLDFDILSILLFPDNKFPRTSLNRVLDEVSYLTSEQVFTLADFLGITIDELYMYSDWKQVPSKTNTVKLKFSAYTVMLNTLTGVTVVYENNKPLRSKKILTSKSMTMDEFLTEIDNYITELKNETNAGN